ncbi:MAG: alpha/beta hydrolase [Acidobacteriaceae bacterium]
MANRPPRKAAPVNPRASASAARPAPPMVDPVWILGAFAAVLLAALLCAYLTLCWFYHQGAWQLVLQPTATISATPATLNIPYENIAFDDTETGHPQLTGWWIPAAPRTDLTILYFHDGRGNLGDTIPALKPLHDLGLNIFAIDYRGFGHSDPIHPSEKRMYADGDAAWAYLTDTRKLPPSRIVVYGDRIGAAVAAQTALRHPDAAAAILIAPFASLLPRAMADPRSRIVPSMLFHERFNLVPQIAQIRQPKLVGFTGTGSCSSSPAPQCPSIAEVQQLYAAAAFPKLLFNGNGSAVPPTAYTEFLSRFLDEYVPRTAAALQ